MLSQLHQKLTRNSHLLFDIFGAPRESVSCDLTVDETVNRLNALNDGYGPYNPNSAFQPWGKAMRDKNAAELIRKYMDTRSSAWGHALLMFGADHFVAEGDRNALPLNKLIKEKIGRSHNVYLIRAGAQRLGITGPLRRRVSTNSARQSRG